MNELLDVEIILNRKKYSKIYNFGIICMLLSGIFLLIANIYDYHDYLVTEGQIKNNRLELIVKSNEIKYVINNNYLLIDNMKYQYNTVNISETRYYNDQGIEYQYVYIDVAFLEMIDNYVYRVKFFKEKQKLINYLMDYLKSDY